MRKKLKTTKNRECEGNYNLKLKKTKLNQFDMVRFKLLFLKKQ